MRCPQESGFYFTVVFPLYGIPSKDGEPDGDGCEYGNNDDPGQGLMNILVTRLDMGDGAPEQGDDGHWTQYDPDIT